MSSSVKQQVIADLKLAGLAPRTQQGYLQVMRQFVADTWVTPEQATEQQVADYLRDLVERRCSQGGFKRTRAALQFLFENSLRHHDWTVFKKDAPCPSVDACPIRPASKTPADCWQPSAIPSTAPAWS